ncbi:MAG TPA: glycoside hydrolase family 31 protein [Casimicrobiaceae bacterium]|nr:glycoside hydrolase family 31 protein [Casimicrobiaceae bacterium]
MRPLAEAHFAGRTNDGVAFDLDAGWQCRVFVLADDLVRVLFVQDGALKEPRTWMVAPNGRDVAWGGHDRLDVSRFACPAFALHEEDDRVVVETPAMRASIHLRPCRIEWSFGDVPFAADRASDPYAWHAPTSAVRHAMARDLRDQYFGLGDKTGPLDKHGRRLRTVALDALGYDGETSDPLYKHWPFLIVRDRPSGIAFGQFYDSLAPMTFDLGCEHDNYRGLYRYAEIEDGDLDYYVFPGPRIRDVVRKFTELTGRMAFGPRWSLGYANTAMALADAPDAQAQLAGFCDRLVEYDVPISSFHFGSGYTTIGKRRYVFTWNRDKFPQPKAALARFARQRIRTVANVKPCLLTDHPAYADVAARDAFVRDPRNGSPVLAPFWDGEGAHVDFTNRDGVAWWQDGLTKQVLGYGFDAGWNDNNEYGIWNDAGESRGFGAAIPIRRSRPLQPLLMTRATFEAQAAHRADERPFTVTRAGPPGIQRYAQTWSGDNTTSWRMLRWNIRMGLTMSLSGMFNTGHDVGGFAGPVPDAELLVRWAQNGAFSPRFIMNSWKPDGVFNSPWLHPEALPLIRDAIRFRYRLLPYLYSLYRHAATHGEPMLRPTFYEFESDPATFADCDDFMLGPNLLVASVVEPGARVRRVYLPKGPSRWFDFWTGRAYASGREAEVAAPLGLVPLFVPAGGMIALTDSTAFDALHDERSRQLRIYPARGDSESTFVLYEDDGVSHRYENGEFAEVRFELRSTARSIELRAQRSGVYPVQEPIRVVPTATERRRLALRGEGVALVA